MSNFRPKNRRKVLWHNDLRRMPIANGMPQNNLFYGMRFALATLRHCKETFRLQPKYGPV
jgi:hypothetical protein